MSARRAENDAYYTPAEDAARCVGALDLERDPAWITEPSVGIGRFADALRTRFPDAVLTGIDVDPMQYSIASLNEHHTATDWLRCKLDPKPELIAGNPPYCDAERHVRHALEQVAPGGTVAFLLREAFKESQKRGPFWDSQVPFRVLTLRKRPAFCGTQSAPKAPYAWFMWRNDGIRRRYYEGGWL